MSFVAATTQSILVGTGLPSPGPELGTLDAEGESDSDVGKILGGAATNICFLFLLVVMLMCLSGKGRLGLII